MLLQDVSPLCFQTVWVYLLATTRERNNRKNWEFFNGKVLAPAAVIYSDYLNAFFLYKNLFHQSIEEIWELSPPECLPLRQNEINCFYRCLFLPRGKRKHIFEEEIIFSKPFLRLNFGSLSLLPLSPNFFGIKTQGVMWDFHHVIYASFPLTPGRNPVYFLLSACSVEILAIRAPRKAGVGEHYQLSLNPQCPKLSVSSSWEQQVHLRVFQISKPPGMWPKVPEALGPLIVAWDNDQGLWFLNYCSSQTTLS